MVSFKIVENGDELEIDHTYKIYVRIQDEGQWQYLCKFPTYNMSKLYLREIFRVAGRRPVYNEKDELIDIY